MKHLPLSLALLSTTAAVADSNTILVPEGKIANHLSAFGDITPSAGPRVIDGVGLFFTGDYIYWTAREDGLDYAISGMNINTSTTGGLNFLPNGQGKRSGLHFPFRPGLKAGMGFSFGHDKWDLYINYTWLNSVQNKGSVSPQNGNTLSNLIPVAMANRYDAIGNGSASWHLLLNVIDLELGRNFYISKFLSLRPFFGFKGTWQTQKYRFSYDFASGTDLNSKNTNDILGIGIRGGVDTAWHLAGTWSIYGNIATSILWEDFQTKRKDVIEESTVILYNTKQGFHTMAPVLELEVGLRKEEWFCKDRFHLAVQGGWEQQVWFDQNQFDFYTLSADGNLTLQGLTVKIRFDF